MMQSRSGVRGTTRRWGRRRHDAEMYLYISSDVVEFAMLDGCPRALGRIPDPCTFFRALSDGGVSV